MTLVLGPLLLLLPVLIGGLVIHLLWPDRRAMALLLKLSLGIGLGLGISSIIYFSALLIAPGRINMLAALLVVLFLLIIVVFRREGAAAWPQFRLPRLRPLQWGLLAFALAALILTLSAFANLSIARPQGSFDAWGIWNRTARFIFRDPANWKATFSPNLFWLMHADYPLLVPLNVAWSWDVLGYETNRTPSMQSFLFLFGTLAVLFTATSFFRSVGQGSLASLVLAGVPSLLFTGYGQISDIPLAFLILSTCVLIYAGYSLTQPRLFVVAGCMAGLAAWTKNEGLVFAPVALCAVLVVGRKAGFAAAKNYLFGLLMPAAVVLYFKSFLAPASEFASGGVQGALAKIADPARYWTILLALWDQFKTFAGWPLSLFLQLAVYAWVVKTRIEPQAVSAVRAVTIVVALQLLGYFAVYLTTPYDLQWHLDTSVHRLVMQLVPAFIFLVFSITLPPEEVFRGAAPQGAADRMVK